MGEVTDIQKRLEAKHGWYVIAESDEDGGHYRIAKNSYPEGINGYLQAFLEEARGMCEWEFAEVSKLMFSPHKKQAYGKNVFKFCPDCGCEIKEKNK